MLELFELIDFVVTVAGWIVEVVSWIGTALDLLDHLRSDARPRGPHDGP